MGAFGGYWRPLAAVARLLEELGELGEELRGPQDEPDACSPPSAATAAELADLWIITTALADQYLATVAEPGALGGGEHARARPGHVRNGVSGERPYPFARLVSAAGVIARIVNYYDGPKTPRDLHGWISIEEAVARFHQALAAVAEGRGADLEAAVETKLAAIPKLDAGRFSATWHDPATASCLTELRRLPEVVDGPLATARLWGGPEWGRASIAEYAEIVAPSLLSFAKAALPERLDGYVIPAPRRPPLATCEDWPAQLLRSIAAREPQPSRLTLRLQTCAPSSEGGEERRDRREIGEHRAFACLEIARG